MEKVKAIEVIEKMPQIFELDELFERLIIIDKIDAAIKDVEERRVTPHSEVRKKAKSWKHSPAIF